MSALDLFCANEGAHTAPQHDLTAPAVPATPTTGDAAPKEQVGGSGDTSRSTNQGAAHGQQVEAARGGHEVDAGSPDGRGTTGSLAHLVAGHGVEDGGADGLGRGHQQDRHGTSPPSEAAARSGGAAGDSQLVEAGDVAQVEAAELAAANGDALDAVKVGFGLGLIVGVGVGLIVFLGFAVAAARGLL